MDAFGDIIENGFDGLPVEIEHDDMGFWAKTDRLLVAGPFHSHNKARFWLADPEFRREHLTDRYGLSLWCVRNS